MTRCKTAAASPRLDEAFEPARPAVDPAALTEPADDAREASGCCCAPSLEQSAKPAPARGGKSSGCGGGG